MNWGGVACAYVESAGNISSGRWDCILADAQVYNKQTMAAITQVTEELGDMAESYDPRTAAVFDWYVTCSRVTCGITDITSIPYLIDHSLCLPSTG